MCMSSKEYGWIPASRFSLQSFRPEPGRLVELCRWSQCPWIYTRWLCLWTFFLRCNGFILTSQKHIAMVWFGCWESYCTFPGWKLVRDENHIIFWHKQFNFGKKMFYLALNFEGWLRFPYKNPTNLNIFWVKYW